MNAKWIDARLAPHMSNTIPQQSALLYFLCTVRLWLPAVWNAAEMAKHHVTPAKYNKNTTASIGCAAGRFRYRAK
jgi:hypothetical protein